jgi:hypothetical protein
MKAFYREADVKTRRQHETRTGALFLAVCRGKVFKNLSHLFFTFSNLRLISPLFVYLFVWQKVSEGLDFADHRARGVIVIGVPYANITDTKIQLKMGYNNANIKVD